MSKDAEYDAKNFPADLNKNNKVKTGQDYFTIPVVDLKIGQQYSFNFQWVYPNGKVSPWSDGLTLTTAGYVTKLTKPTIIVTPAALGYTVSYTKQTDSNFAYAIVEEVISSASTAPTNGWTERDVSSSNPIQVTTGLNDIANRWVRIKLTDRISGSSPYSDPVSVKPFDPVADAIDVTPPNEVTITSAQWVTSGLTEEIQIAYTIPTNGGSEFQIFLTNGTKTRSVSEYPTATGSSQIARISKVQLEALFGVEYPTSFTGLFKSIDKAKNPSAGTPFTVAAKGNALVGVTPTATATAMINGFSISWNLGTAKIAKVYTSTTSGFTPNESSAPQYYGAGPYIQNTSLTSGFATVYFKVKFFGDTETDFSGFSAEGSVTPINPDTTDTTPPPTITSVTGVGASNLDDPSGISGQVTLTIVQPTMPVDFAGYSVKIINGAQTWYQEFPSTTALSTLVVKNGIYIGQSYTLSVATRDKTNLQSYISCSNNPIAINDTRVNTSVVTGLSVSSTDSIATVSWTAPEDNKVGSYRVMITSNADTTFSSPIQTIYTDSSQTSFGGLTASTTYRVRVTTKYSNGGLLSTQNTDGSFTLDSSGAISDGIAPTTNPALTSSMVKSLFKAFAITFPGITNSDAVTYEVFIKPTNSTGIVDAQYKVLEVAGTFAVVRTLADRTTELEYGTNYYIAIRAKDNDGVSTGTVTAVGPIQTAQVANADLAENSVYANNIFAGQIDASKMVTDLLFAEKTINVGESTSLNRIRLDANTIAAGTAGYSNPSDAIKSRIFIGSGTYNNSGTPFYADNLGRFSLKDKLQFDGNNLQIDANGSFGGLLTAGPTGQEVKIGLAAGGGTNHGIYLASTGDYIYNSGNFRLGAGKITYNGTLLDITSQVNITGNSTVVGDLGVVASGATFYAGASKSTGNRVVMNSGGLFGYNGTTINFSFPNSTGLFTLGSGDISGWSVSSGNIEKITGSTYAGISTGTYAFYAGGGSAGSGSPKFKVTQAGVMTAEGVQINGGSLDVGPAWPTGGFHVNTSGVLQAKGATIAGALSIEGGSTFAGNIEVTSGGTIFMGSSDANTNRVVLTSAGISGYAAAAPIFTLNTSGTGTIGGWNFNATTLSSSGMTFNSSDQTITFKNGFIMDNDIISVPVVSSTSSSGSSSSELDTAESEYSSFASGSNSSASSTFAIKLPTQNTTNSPKFVMTNDATSGSSILLSNYGNGSFSSIQLANGGVDISLGRTGAITLRGFTAKAHYSYGNGTAFSGTIVPAMLMIKPDGTVSSGRSIFKSGTSETSINNGSHNHVGLIGDIILSTQD
jgi:hypothetical protein